MKNNTGSSNGRTAAFEAPNEGSTPSPVARNYHMEWYEKNKESRIKQVAERRKIKKHEARVFVAEYLRQHPCVVCEEDDIVVLEFDHLTEKKMNVSKMVEEGRTIKAIQEEIDKCEVVCANCHRRRTSKRGGHWRSLA